MPPILVRGSYGLSWLVLVIIDSYGLACMVVPGPVRTCSLIRDACNLPYVMQLGIDKSRMHKMVLLSLMCRTMKHSLETYKGRPKAMAFGWP